MSHKMSEGGSESCFLPLRDAVPMIVRLKELYATLILTYCSSSWNGKSSGCSVVILTSSCVEVFPSCSARLAMFSFGSAAVGAYGRPPKVWPKLTATEI